MLQAVLNLARTKAAAVLLGPSGVGLIGLFQSMISTGAVVGSMGLNNAGVRQIAAAEAAGDPGHQHSARAAVALQSTVFAILAGGLLALFREPVAVHVLRDASLAGSIGWIGIGVALGVIGSGQFALLNGLRQVQKIATAQVVSALVSTIIGVAFLFFWREEGILAFILVSPLSIVFICRFLIWRLPSLSWRDVRLELLLREARALLELGFPAMLGAVLGTGGLLAARAIVTEQAGLDLLGQYQAAWLISVTSITFILNAMLADFLPKVSAAGEDHVVVRSLISRQQEMGLLMAAPIVLVVMALAPGVVLLLFSSAFDQTAEILRWHLLGDVIRVLSWPLSYALLAGGAGRRYLAGELVGLIAFLVALWHLLPLFGGVGAGMAYLIMAVVQGIVLLGFNWRSYGFVTARPVAALTMTIMSAGVASLWLGSLAPNLAAVLGLAAAGLVSLFALARLSELAELGGLPGWLATRSRALMGHIRMSGRSH